MLDFNDITDEDKFDSSLDTGDGRYLDPSGFQELSVQDLLDEDEATPEAEPGLQNQVQEVPVQTSSAPAGSSLADAHRAIQDKILELLSLTEMYPPVSPGQLKEPFCESLRAFFLLPDSVRTLNFNRTVGLCGLQGCSLY